MITVLLFKITFSGCVCVGGGDVGATRSKSSAS
jgi:hypothetical protein